MSSQDIFFTIHEIGILDEAILTDDAMYSLIGKLR